MRSPTFAILILAVFCVSAFFLGRLIIILLGWWKAPVLKSLEPYAPVESLFDPLPLLLFWVGMLILNGGLFVSIWFDLRTPLFLIGALLIYLAYFVYQRSEKMVRSLRILHYPRWYDELRTRTTREERRRIAYMWLRLPDGTRAAFNTNHAAFNQWVDLVILATVQQTVYDPQLEEQAQRRSYGVPEFHS
jgi:hypothetical protein